MHCNSLADDELKMMADAGCTASISPDIELQMGHGWPATGRLLEAGMRPSLSIDVCCSNGGHLFGTIRATIGTQRGFDNEAAASGGLERARADLPRRARVRDDRGRARRAAWTARSAR